MEETKICCICGQVFVGYGNDPWPVRMEGQCCNDCNMDQVIPARMLMLKEHEHEM